MNKKEEIREGLAEGLFKYNNPYEEWGTMPRQTQDTFRSRANRMLLWLNEQGVVRKVDRELSVFMCRDRHCEYECHKAEQKRMLKAGYVAFEPLIDN